MNTVYLSIGQTLKQRFLVSDFITSIVFLIIISVVRLRFDTSFLFFWIGGLLGTEFLPLAENIFQHDLKLSKPVFHTLIFQAILAVLSFYVLSSSGSLFGIGFVMVMNLQLLKDEIFELRSAGKLSPGWFLYLREERLNPRTVGSFIILLVLLFLLLALSFSRV